MSESQIYLDKDLSLLFNMNNIHYHQLADDLKYF